MTINEKITLKSGSRREMKMSCNLHVIKIIKKHEDKQLEMSLAGLWITLLQAEKTEEAGYFLERGV